MNAPYTISELTTKIKATLEENIPRIWVIGEISNFTLHISGHRYFTLKDEQTQIRCVMWKWQAQKLFFTPQNGMKVLAQGDVTVYERGGQYQLDITQLQPAGIGELQLAFERLKGKLEAEGLFAPEQKKSIPQFPETIGVVTSPTGAAIRDIAQIIGRRFPATQIVLCPAKVQGEGAAEEIVDGIETLNRYGKIDVLIVGRGGGSLEDLWAFNEEIVVRAIASSKIPVISAVGHEIDYTLSDLAADFRAPTPSAASELVVPDKEELKNYILTLFKQSRKIISERLLESQRDIEALTSSRSFRRVEDLIEQHWQIVDDLQNSMVLALDRRFVAKMSAYRALIGKLDALSPFAVFRRGFSVCFKLPKRTIIKKASDLSSGDSVEIRFENGQALCHVEESTG